MAERSASGRDAVADRFDPSNERTRLGGAGALVAAVGLLVFPGGNAAVAIVGALVVLGGWYLAGPAYAFALGHLALAAMMPEGGGFFQGPDLVWLVPIEVGLLGTLLASLTGPSRDRIWVRGWILVVGWVVVGGLLAWASAESSLGLPAAAGLLVAVFALAAYGLHRYQLVSLGLVGEGDSGSDDTDDGDSDE
jgi:hypothetical protein